MRRLNPAEGTEAFIPGGKVTVHYYGDTCLGGHGELADIEAREAPTEIPAERDGYLPRHDLKTAESHIKWLEAEVLRLREAEQWRRMADVLAEALFRAHKLGDPEIADRALAQYEALTGDGSGGAE